MAIGSDDRTPLTDAVLENLRARGVELECFGALKDSTNPSWPQVAQRVGLEVASGRCRQGVLFCYTGTGVSIAANKVPGVRAALCADGPTARGARLWNDANVLCMSLRLTSPELAQEILDAWPSTPEVDPSESENIEAVKNLDHLQSKDGIKAYTIPDR